MKIYVASSWRNEQQGGVVKALRAAGHEVYDFKNPSETDKGFSWADIDPNWQQWTNEEYQKALEHPLAEKGFMNDFNAMQWADACVMVMPCGRSAHVEAGYIQGAGKPTIVLMEKEAEPELMYKMFELVCNTLDQVLEHVAALQLAMESIERDRDPNAEEDLLKDFLQFVEGRTYFFEDKDVTAKQVIRAYLNQTGKSLKPTLADKFLPVFAGFHIIVQANPVLRDGKGYMYLSSNDYKNYSDKVKKHG